MEGFLNDTQRTVKARCAIFHCHYKDIAILTSVEDISICFCRQLKRTIVEGLIVRKCIWLNRKTFFESKSDLVLKDRYDLYGTKCYFDTFCTNFRLNERYSC